MIATYQFLRELRSNNRREWFAEHKAQYDTLRSRWLDQLQHLIGLMSQYDGTLHGVKATDCAYRIYRDIRFSHDKTPYKTFFSAVIGQGGRKCSKACYYVHFEPGNSGLFAGLWCPTPDVLRRTRSLIDADGNELQAIITNPDFASRFSFTPFQTLKKAPAGYSPDHPLINLLRAKDYTFSHDCPDTYFTNGNWAEKAAADLKTAKPVLDFFNYVFE
ncbi:MAG: DUF2461 domain-containing protein [Muribaculaceae bacterium]